MILMRVYCLSGHTLEQTHKKTSSEICISVEENLIFVIVVPIFRSSAEIDLQHRYSLWNSDE